MPYRRFASAMVVMVAPLALSACSEPAPLYVDQAYVRMNPNPGAPAAGYMTIHGGEAAAKLLSVSTEGARRIEMHESINKDGMMTMAAIQSVEVPAKTEVRFAPGGKHLMIFNINPAIVKEGKLTMTMIFSNGDRLIVDAPIQKASPTSDPADADHDMGKMDMASNAAMADHGAHN